MIYTIEKVQEEKLPTKVNAIGIDDFQVFWAIFEVLV